MIGESGSIGRAMHYGDAATARFLENQKKKAELAKYNSPEQQLLRGQQDQAKKFRANMPRSEERRVGKECRL